MVINLMAKEKLRKKDGTFLLRTNSSNDYVTVPHLNQKPDQKSDAIKSLFKSLIYDCTCAFFMFDLKLCIVFAFLHFSHTVET